MVFLGGDKRDRTAGLLNAIQALSQLSYTPVFNHPQQLRHVSKRNLDFHTIFKTILATFVFGYFVKFCRSKGWSTGYYGLPAELYFNLTVGAVSVKKGATNSLCHEGSDPLYFLKTIVGISFFTGEKLGVKNPGNH